MDTVLRHLSERGGGLQSFIREKRILILTQVVIIKIYASCSCSLKKMKDFIVCIICSRLNKISSHCDTEHNFFWEKMFHLKMGGVVGV